MLLDVNSHRVPNGQRSTGQTWGEQESPWAKTDCRRAEEIGGSVLGTEKDSPSWKTGFQLSHVVLEEREGWCRSTSKTAAAATFIIHFHPVQLRQLQARTKTGYCGCHLQPPSPLSKYLSAPGPRQGDALGQSKKLKI